MEMNYNAVPIIWDSFKDVKTVPFRSEKDGIFPQKILSPEQEEELMEIMDSLDKGSGWETEGETEPRLRDDAEVPKHSIQHEKIRAEDDQVFAENAVLAAQNELNALLDQLEPKRPIPREKTSQTDLPPSPHSHVSDLLEDTKQQLAGMKAFAAFAKDKFRDPELGMRYQKAFLRRIDKTMALLSSYTDYLSLSNPRRKSNTVNGLFEKVLKRHTEQLEDQQIEIIKKQFAEDLPETTVPEVQLEYILDSLMQYITHSVPPHGNLGLLTRIVDDPKKAREENDLPRKGQKYVEILFVFSTPDKKTDTPSSSPKGQGMELILRLVQEIIEKNKGFMEIKPSDKTAMTFISLRVPIERRTVLEFKPIR
jgi:hypothetical protein